MSAPRNQFEFALTVADPQGRRPRTPEAEVRAPSVAERVNGIDQVLSTRDIERITGRHRCTIYRWVLAGTFPERRAGGGRGWLRSDVERWLLRGGGCADGDRPTPKAPDVNGV
jgi:predicted DNA-binding transcriptional regulator AlpA